MQLIALTLRHLRTFYAIAKAEPLSSLAIAEAKPLIVLTGTHTAVISYSPP